MSLEAISIKPQNSEPKNILVMLHGWGANAEDLAPLSSMLNLPDYQLLFPNAPFPHPEVPGGLAWYALDTGKYEGIDESRQMLKDWLLSLEENTGIPLSRTILSGFSQGGAMSLDVGINFPLAGICSLSGYLQFQPQKLASILPPILIIHGKNDMVVPLEMAKKARDELTAIDAKIEYYELAMGHEIPANILPIFEKFIKANN
ncbi:alpha/beta hydrolase [Crocosphaera watsonii]|uniref:Phospholipase/carboxylesterase family protein,sll1284 homolog n=4 Tax=Crocosphaera watsonii TaxID=263511 RepID=T2JQ18_CROWT|nr:dienelactone hydrolase family protein [Crocosphaera watsonii]EHJ11419.1 Phospholipase/carboxylesterase family protein [Crocosphaera watsonii WH 0003]CCQ49462.1 Phospholipase/carboxylesterase family protein, sll1284 homolog [Crocosphaera watsonii WH 8502]CCQ54290.1 Phospholipase/carboxylesterase family protein,sll1284 homolog [Crocosphaera watsonii WH 0005]CCQ67141.1 Phospholipase/carboxylesterase family protein,sll1284 homolog [Crocosphaera watsonii WH 0402]